MSAGGVTAARERGIQERHLRLGEIELSVQSELPEVLEDLDVLYAAYQAPSCRTGVIRLEARAGPWSPRRGRQFVVRADGAAIYGPHPRNEVYPILEFSINGRVIATRSQFLQVHAATLARNGAALMLAGGSGVGKSTLAAGLLARGWTYFCDEFALLDPQTLCVHPFPKALSIKAGSFEIIRQLGLPLWRRRHYSKHFKGPVGYIRPPGSTRPRATPCPVRQMVFPRYAAECEPALRPMPRAAAAMTLARCTLNHHAFGVRVMPILCALVRGAECFELDAGPI